MSADDVRRIVSEPGADPVTAARKARSAGSGHHLEATAADRAISPRGRAIALLAVAEHCAVTREDLPESVLEAVEDPAVVSAAITAGISQALSGALAAAPDDPVTQATRKLVAARLSATGAGGIAVAMLLVAAGELSAGARTLASEFQNNLNTFENVGDPAALGWGTAVARLATSRPSVFDELCERISEDSPESLAVLADLIEASPAVSGPDQSAATDAIERARLLATS